LVYPAAYGTDIKRCDLLFDFITTSLDKNLNKPVELAGLVVTLERATVTSTLE
jgi:hypothetical protein